MKEKNTLITKTIEVITLIVLYYIVGNKSIFLYTLSLCLYNIFSSCLEHISIKDNLKITNNTKLKDKIFIYTELMILVFSLLFLLLGIMISDITGIVLNIDNTLLIFIMMGLTIFTKPFIKVLSEYLNELNTTSKYQKIINIYQILDNILLIIIALITFRLIKIETYIAIALLYLSKIISIMIITSLMYLINKDKKKDNNSVKENIKLKKEIKKILTKDSYKSIINIVKNSYYYISIVILYLVLNTRYDYELELIEKNITFIYLYSLVIVNYLIYLAKLLNSELPKEMSLTSRMYNNFKIMLSIAIIFGIISPLTCKVIFYNPTYAIYLAMTNIMAIFILLYNITYENIKSKKIIYISLILGIVTKIVLIVPLINAFYRMGYNLIYGDIISTIIGMFLSIIINYIYIRNTEKGTENYFEKILNILYENILLCIILIIIQFIIPMNTDNYFKSLGLITIYIMVSVIFIKIKNKKRG